MQSGLGYTKYADCFSCCLPSHVSLFLLAAEHMREWER